VTKNKIKMQLENQCIASQFSNQD